MTKELTLEQDFLRLLLQTSVYLIQPHVTDPHIYDRRIEPECYKDFDPVWVLPASKEEKALLEVDMTRHVLLCASQLLCQD
jgi:hypothetical protein